MALFSDKSKKNGTPNSSDIPASKSVPASSAVFSMGECFVPKKVPTMNSTPQSNRSDLSRRSSLRSSSSNASLKLGGSPLPSTRSLTKRNDSSGVASNKDASISGTGDATAKDNDENMDVGDNIPTAKETSGPSDTDAPEMDTADETVAPSGPGPIEIIISFDTTGSMSYILDEVKNRITDIINRLFMDIPSLKIGVIAHGDYCDEKVFYLTQAIELTNDAAALCSFVSNVEGTGGGDFAECYELILRKVRQVDWTPGSKRALIMIGDACPHTPDELLAGGYEVINWVHEATNLINDMVSFFLIK